jgi:hypothetical protein
MSARSALRIQVGHRGRDTLIEGFSHFVTSMTAPIASGWSGGIFTHWKAPSLHGARHVRTSTIIRRSRYDRPSTLSDTHLFPYSVNT